MSDKCLIGSAIPILMLQREILNPHKEDKPLEYELVRQKMEYHLQDFCKQANSILSIESLVKDAQFALVALIDESMSRSVMSIRDRWLSQPLQMTMFGSLTAGEEFYARASALMQQGALADPVIEVYYLCLALGFRGQYTGIDTDQPSLLAGHLYHRIDAGSRPGEHHAIYQARSFHNRYSIFSLSAFAIVMSVFLWVSILVMSLSSQQSDFLRSLGKANALISKESNLK